MLTRLVSSIRNELEAGRLVFDDFGALFWQLIHEYPTIGDAYRRKYPIVIADEHQDASGLQDAVVRELGLPPDARQSGGEGGLPQAWCRQVVDHVIEKFSFHLLAIRPLKG